MPVANGLRAAALVALLAAAPAAAEGPVDLLFDTPHLATLAEGQTVAYVHERRSGPAAQVGPDVSERIVLEKTAPDASTLVLDADGRARTLEFGALPGNPLLMVFLENTVRATAQATGGSPFYLRNRVKDAMRAGFETDEAGRLTLRPFAQDENRARLGAFAGLRMTFEIDETAPGMLTALRAETEGESYVEEFRLEQGG